MQKLANGEFVSLGKIESSLRNSPFVENICVCNDRFSNHLTAVISPNPRALLELGGRLGKSADASFEELCSDEAVKSAVFQSLKQLAISELGLKPKEVPVAITLVKETWDQDNGLLTAAMKMKRKQVNDFYQAEIQTMFEQLAQTAPATSNSSDQQQQQTSTPNVAQQ